MVIDSSLVNGVMWEVAGFEDDKLGKFHPVPWRFNGNGTVEASGYWSGTWIEIGQNQIRTSIRHSSGETDGCDVLFLTPDRFIAVRGGRVYRYGRRW